MRHSVTFLLLGAAQLLLGWQFGVHGWAWIWSGAVFITVGVAYAREWPGLFGKRADGTLPAWRIVALLPYLLFTWVVWYLETHWSQESVCHEVAPGVWLGRRPSSKDIPKDAAHVIDLTAEFGEPRGVRERGGYHALPTLDATVPDRTATEAIICDLAQSEETCYVHCALGHGRSALVAALLLVEQRQAKDLEDAMIQITCARPGVKLNAAQWKWLWEWEGQ